MRSTVARRLSTLCSFYRYCHLEGLVHRNPGAKRAPPPKSTTSSARHLHRCRLRRRRGPLTQRPSGRATPSTDLARHRRLSCVAAQRELRIIGWVADTIQAAVAGGRRSGAAITQWAAAWNENSKPFVWRKTADEILETLPHTAHEPLTHKLGQIPTGDVRDEV